MVYVRWTKTRKYAVIVIVAGFDGEAPPLWSGKGYAMATASKAVIIPPETER
jgi:hypothetical protein